MADTTTHIDPLLRLGVLGERLSRVHRLIDDELHKLQGEFDAFASELGAPDIEDARVQARLAEREGGDGNGR